MNSSYEYLRHLEPNLISRECGGWLAVSSHDAPIRIGVLGISETEAREKFRESMAKWIEYLSVAA